MPTEATHHIGTSSLEFKNRKPNTIWVWKRREKATLHSKYGQLDSSLVSPVVLTKYIVHVHRYTSVLSLHQFGNDVHIWILKFPSVFQ